MPAVYCDEYAGLLEACRQARVSAQQSLDRGYDEKRQSELWDVEREAFDRLVPVEGSIRQVLVHSAQLSDLIIRRRLSSNAVNDAVGHDVLREREAIEAVTRRAYDFGGCVAPAFEEARWCADLTADEISPRIGWARALVSSPATLSRIDVLLDLLAIRAENIGDGVPAITGDHQRRDVGKQQALAVRWRVLRRSGLMPALRSCCRATWMHQKVRQPSWMHQKVRQPSIYPLTTLLSPSLYGLRQLLIGSLRWICRPVIVGAKVAAAAAMSRNACDPERWVSRIEVNPNRSDAEMIV